MLKRSSGNIKQASTLGSRLSNAGWGPIDPAGLDDVTQVILSRVSAPKSKL